jgi:hypothetical protein
VSAINDGANGLTLECHPVDTGGGGGVIECVPRYQVDLNALTFDVGVSGPFYAQWIDLYNPCDAPLSLDGWSVVLRNDLPPPMFTTKTLVTFPAGTVIAGHSYILTASPQYTGAVVPDAGWTDAPGYLMRGVTTSVWLFDPDYGVVDAVCWGGFVPGGNCEVGGLPKVQFGTGNGFRRSSPGADSQNNANDFVLDPAPVPHNSAG